MRRPPVTKGRPAIGPRWDWHCHRGHFASTLNGVILLRCPFARCSSTNITPCSPDGNPVRLNNRKANA